MSARRVVLKYVAFSAAWIVMSDWALDQIFREAAARATAQSLKGLAFVAVSAILLYYLVRRSQRKHAHLQRAAMREKSKMAHILNVSPAATYALRWMHKGFVVDFISRNIESIMGYPTSQWMADPTFWHRHIHPDDVAATDQAQLTLMQRGRVTHEYRFLHANGSYRWVQDNRLLKRDAQGRPEVIYGTWLDATERRRSEEHGRLITQVFDGSQEGIFVTDHQVRIISVNRAFTQITGYTFEEAEGKSPSLLKSGLQDAAFYQAMWADIHQNGRWEGEIWNRRQSGELFPEWLTISAIKDSHGVVQQYLGIFTETSGRKAAEERIQRLVNFDALTGLPNRGLLSDRATIAFSAANRSHASVVIMHLNLDHFGSVNESLGHEAGDQVLIEVARRLTMDLRPEDTVSRMGGDDFIVLIPDSSAHDIAGIASRITTCIAEPMWIADHELTLSASIGIATYPENGTDLLKLTQSAESAVHLAKKEGRNQFHFVSPSLQEEVTRRLAMERELRHAIERQQLILHYQPQVDIQSGQIIGTEALIRWQHPEWGLVSPAQFIPIAEESGLIRDIGKWVLLTAAKQNARWHEEGLKIVPVAVNLSMVQFKDRRLRDDVLQTLQDSNLPAHMLELELTESVAMANSDFTISTIDALKRLGVTLSIDDFGTGYSSLSYLKRFAVDKLKIDQSFVRGLHMDPHDEAIVRTVISLAKSLGLKTIAEGVETAEQLAFLSTTGCDEFQGYLYSRPIPPDQLALLLSPATDCAVA